MIETLTPKELQILKLIAQGYSNKEISKQVSLKSSTVGTHIAGIYSVLDLDDEKKGGSTKRVKATLIYLKESKKENEKK